jgi:rhodanese-related sulfurtransferase
MKTIGVFLKVILFIFLAVLIVQCNSSIAKQHLSSTSNIVYKCIPCGYDCDKDIYTKPGKCTHCKMELVDTTTINFNTIAASAICQYIQDHPEVVLLDVRTKEEFEGKASPDYGTLKNAINLPIQQFDSSLKVLNIYKGKAIIVYCSHSHRSPRASYLLTQNGFTNITNMAGGMSELNDNACKR